MKADKISRSEADLIGFAYERIISAEVLESTMEEQLPLKDDMADLKRFIMKRYRYCLL